MIKEYKPGKDIAVIAFLLTICVLRLLTQNSKLFSVLSLISIYIAGYDIYSCIEAEYEIYEGRFFVVRGFFLCLAVISAIAMAFLLIMDIHLPSIVSDEMTTIALLMCLPKELYCYFIGKFIKGEENS